VSGVGRPGERSGREYCRRERSDALARLTAPRERVTLGGNEYIVPVAEAPDLAALERENMRGHGR